MDMNEAIRLEFAKLPEEWRQKVRKALCALSDDCDDANQAEAASETLFDFAEMADTWCQRRNDQGDYSVAPVWKFLLPQFIDHWDSDGDELGCDGPFDEDGICPHCQEEYDWRQRTISWLLATMLRQAHQGELESVPA